MPQLLHIVLAIVAATLAGAVWAGIAGLLKATVGAHEVISTIMLNWIAIWVGVYLFELDGPLQNPTRRSSRSRSPTTSRRAPSCRSSGATRSSRACTSGSSSRSPRSSSSGSLLNRSTTGYEVRAVGFNPEAARYGGISVARNYILVMAVCGAFAGLAGAMDVLGWQFHIATNDISTRRVGIGFIGIAVALLGRNTAIGTRVRGAAVRRAAQRHVAAQPRPDDLRARAGHEPDAASSRAWSCCSSAPT